MLYRNPISELIKPAFARTFTAAMLALALTALSLVAAIALSLCALTSLTGCSAKNNASSGETRAIIDMRGRTVDIPVNLEKIVAVGCALRPVVYLQATDMVVGVEAAEQEDNVSCGYRHVNQAKFTSLPVIGTGGSSGVQINEEALMKAAPQVVICDSLSADEANNLQQKTGITFVCLDQPETFFDTKYYENLMFLGDVLGKKERAQAVVSYISEIESDLQTRSAASANAGNVSAYAAGISFRGGHGFDGTEANFQPFIACNIDNVADGHGAQGPFTIDLETVAQAQPDYIFMDCNNLPLIKENYDSNPAFYQALSAVQQSRTYSLLSYRFYSTNVEIALADCYQVGAMVYPDSFEGIDPNQKLDEISEFFLGAPLSADLAAKGFTFRQLNIASL